MLSENARNELIDRLAQMRLQTMFGDGMEIEYILDGINMVGLNNLSDRQLIQEYEENTDPSDVLAATFLEMLLGLQVIKPTTPKPPVMFLVKK